MKTALDLAMDRADALEWIPPITDPLGRHWNQPNRRDIVVDDTHALMSARTFARLATYSCSRPSGVYVGKMWKRHNGAHDQEFLAAGGKPEWMLAWYGPCEEPDCCSVNHRLILLADEPAAVTAALAGAA